MSLHRRHIRGNFARRAYTFIELLIVVLIISIVAAAGTPKFAESITRFRVEAIVQRITGDLKYARRTAQRTSNTVTMNFDVTNNKYTLSGVSNINRRDQAFEFSLADAHYGCVLVSATFGAGSSLTFNIYGQPNSSGTIVVRCGDLTQTITINTSGQVVSS
jgi:prepilin-type N-terminal cleavage/methylation domain-containing protein